MVHRHCLHNSSAQIILTKYGWLHIILNQTDQMHLFQHMCHTTSCILFILRKTRAVISLLLSIDYPRWLSDTAALSGLPSPWNTQTPTLCFSSILGMYWSPEFMCNFFTHCGINKNTIGGMYVMKRTRHGYQNKSLSSRGHPELSRVLDLY